MIDGLVITFVEVTKVKEVQEKERRLLSALEMSPTVVFGQDLDFRITWACGNVFGYAQHQCLGKTDTDLMPPEQAKNMIGIKRRVLDTGSAMRDTLSIRDADKKRVYDVYVMPELDVDKKLVGITCVLTDITAHT